MNYGPASKYYDLFASKDDVNFYEELALKHGKKALELGVGTGRVAIELEKKGVTVWGVDNSKYITTSIYVIHIIYWWQSYCFTITFCVSTITIVWNN